MTHSGPKYQEAAKRLVFRAFCCLIEIKNKCVDNAY